MDKIINSIKNLKIKYNYQLLNYIDEQLRFKRFKVLNINPQFIKIYKISKRNLFKNIINKYIYNFIQFEIIKNKYNFIKNKNNFIKNKLNNNNISYSFIVYHNNDIRNLIYQFVGQNIYYNNFDYLYLNNIRVNNNIKQLINIYKLESNILKSLIFGYKRLRPNPFNDIYINFNDNFIKKYLNILNVNYNLTCPNHKLIIKLFNKLKYNFIHNIKNPFIYIDFDFQINHKCIYHFNKKNTYKKICDFNYFIHLKII